MIHGRIPNLKKLVFFGLVLRGTGHNRFSSFYQAWNLLILYVWPWTLQKKSFSIKMKVIWHSGLMQGNLFWIAVKKEILWLFNSIISTGFRCVWQEFVYSRRFVFGTYLGIFLSYWWTLGRKNPRCCCWAHGCSWHTKNMISISGLG